MNIAPLHFKSQVVILFECEYCLNVNTVIKKIGYFETTSSLVEISRIVANYDIMVTIYRVRKYTKMLSFSSENQWQPGKCYSGGV